MEPMLSHRIIVLLIGTLSVSYARDFTLLLSAGASPSICEHHAEDMPDQMTNVDGIFAR